MRLQSTCNEIVVHHSRLKMSLMAIGSLAFVVAGIPLLFLRGHGGGIDFVIVGLFVLADILFFGACLLWALKRLLRASPALVINSEGILDDSSAVGAGFVAWEEIESVYVGQIGLQKFLCLVPTDPAAFLLRQPGWKRRLMQTNMKMVGAPITISAVALPISFDELKSRVEECHAANVLARMGLSF